MSSSENLDSTDGAKASSKSSQIADRRLVEYFVIVSSIEQSNTTKGEKKRSDMDFDWKTDSGYQQEDLNSYLFKPTITARYPLHDHPDNPLHDNVTFFCHPSGKIQLRTEEYMPKVRTTKSVICAIYHHSNHNTSLGTLLCRYGRNGTADLRHVSHTLGALHVGSQT